MYRLATIDEFGRRTSHLGTSFENHFEYMPMYKPYITKCDQRYLWGKEIYAISDKGDKYEVTLKNGTVLFNEYFNKELFRDFVVCEPKYKKDDLVVLKVTKEVHKVCKVIDSAFGDQTIMCHTYKYVLDNGDVVGEYTISTKIGDRPIYSVGDKVVFSIVEGVTISGIIKNIEYEYQAPKHQFIYTIEDYENTHALYGVNENHIMYKSLNTTIDDYKKYMHIYGYCMKQVNEEEKNKKFEEEEKNKEKENEKMTYFDYLKQFGGFERLIKSVHFNEKKKTTTVVLINGDIGLSTCMDSDEYDKGVGFAVALQNALFGSKTKAKKFIDSVIERQDKIDNAKKKAKDKKSK